MSDTAEAPDAVRPPRTIVAAFATAIAHVVLSIGNSAILWGFQDYLRRQLIKSNNKAKAKDHKDYSNTPHGLHNLNHDLHNGLKVGLIQIAVFSVLVLLLAINFRKGKGWARWAEILVLIVVVQAPFRLLSLGGNAPILMRAISGLVGLTGVALIVLLLLPESSRYFAAVRGVTAGAGAGTAGPFNLRTLFGPRPRPGEQPPARPAAKVPAKTAPARPPAKQAAKEPAARTAPKAKVRATADESAAASPARPPGSVAAKNRGKSRRGV